VEPQLKLFLRLAFVRSAVLVQTKGWQRSFQPWMKARSSASLLADGAALLDLLMLKDAGVDRSPHRSTWPWVDRRSSVAQVDWRRVSARIMPYVDIATPSIDDLMSTLQSRDRGTMTSSRNVPDVWWRRPLAEEAGRWAAELAGIWSSPIADKTRHAISASRPSPLQREKLGRY
jgi:hypothetical protein